MPLDTGTERILVVVGTLTQAVPHFRHARGEGISIFALNEETGRLALLTTETRIVNPTYVALDPVRHRLFATSERYGPPEGQIHGFEVDVMNGALNWRATQATRGSLTAFCGLDRTGTVLLAANYAHDDGRERPGKHLVSFAIDRNGIFGPATSEYAHLGSGPRSDRQTVPHAHCAVCSPDNRFVLVCDLGTDSIVIYRLHPNEGNVSPHSRYTMPPGSGPRHLTFSPDGTKVYVVNELDVTISVLAYVAETGALRLVDHRALLDAGDGLSAPADIQMASDGLVLYVSLRGADTVATCTIDAEDGRIAGIVHCASGGQTPRSLTLSPCNRFLIVANQDSDNVRVFRLDETTRAPVVETDAIAVGSPMCVRSARFGAVAR